MKLAYLGFYLMEIRTLWATCAANLVWAITWVPGVRIRRFNSPREDIEIFYKFKMGQQSKSSCSSPESGLKVSPRILSQNPTCFRKSDLFFGETIKNTIIIRVVSLETYWILCVLRDGDREKAFWENLSKDWRDSVQVQEISSSCIFFTLVLLWHGFDNIYIRVLFICYG